MEVNLLITCVDKGFYAKHLNESLPIWKKHASSVTVVTDYEDKVTPEVTSDHGAWHYKTDAFYRDGRIFGKSNAMQEALDKIVPWSGWIIFADADVTPPDDWIDQLKGVQAGNLYGCCRKLDDGNVKFEGEIGGFFQCFHTSDPIVQRKPLLETRFTHAGNYDSQFQALWPSKNRITLPMVVRHHGEHGKNWMGVGNDAAMRKMRADRANGKRWQDEIVPL
jgi:hypothetical protein